MKLATLKDGSRDGRLVVVSKNLRLATDAKHIAPNLRTALDDWVRCEPSLFELARDLESGSLKNTFEFDPHAAMAPLPRTSQFVDASAFLNHGNIMEEAYQLTVKKTPGIPILVQRQSDDFIGATEDYPFPTEADQADFEGEFAVVVDDLPMGGSATEAAKHIKLVTMLNDVSMRAHLFRELSMGFGFIQAKPQTCFAPVAVTPDELGDAWHEGRIHLDMRVSRNGEPFGHPNGGEMDWSFGELLAHLSYNRNLRAGTILGSGTVSNRGWREVGSACLAERRATEKIVHGESSTPFLSFGDVLSFDVFDNTGQSVFGAIEHRFVRSGSAT